MNSSQSNLAESWHLDLEEVSALCVRRASADRQELLAVGDEDFVVHMAVLEGDSLRHRRRESARDLLPVKVSRGGGGSEWEAVAADGAGRIFALRESTATVFVFSPNLAQLDHTIHLDLEGSDNAHARRLLDDPNAGPEGLLLLKGGHLLVLKQRDPIVVIEFGPRDHPQKGLSGDAYLALDRSFELSDGSRTTLHALASWELDPRAEATVESANDLALDDRARLHAVSSKSRCIYELDPADARNGRLSIAHLWKLPGGLQAGNDRRAEGLTFDDRGRPLVALDVKDRTENTFLLESLERGNR
jgi:SdiA-regulated